MPNHHFETIAACHEYVTKLKGHQAYLRMLGLRRVYLIFDNELPSAGHSIGAGNLAMRQHSKELSRYFDVKMGLCPSSDPSEALKSAYTAEKLRSILRNTVRTAQQIAA